MNNVVIYPYKKGNTRRKKQPGNQKVKTEADIQQDIKSGVYDKFIADRIIRDPKIITRKDPATATVTTQADKQKLLVLRAGLLYDFRNPEEVEDRLSNLQKNGDYDNEDLAKAFGVDEVEDDFTSVYKKDHLYKFHDAIRVDGSYSNAVEKTSDFVTGIDYTHIVYDVNNSFPTKELESKELVKLNNNFALFSIKTELEEIDRTVNLRRVILSTMINMRTFGRSCHLIYRDDFTKLPVAINPLNPIGLSRVFYKKGSWQVLGVECDHLDETDRLQPASKLIYAVNRDHGQSPGSLLYGYSDVEYFSHLVETNFVMNAFDLKELNRNYYTPKKIVQVLTQDSRDVTEIKNAITQGNVVVTKHKTDVKDLTGESHSLDLTEQRSQNDDKITQESGMPNILMGKRTSDTFAVATQVMQMFNQTTAKKWRMVIREIYEPQYYNRNMKQIVRNRLDFLNKIKYKYEDGNRTSDVILQEILPLNKRDALTEGEEEQLDSLQYEYLLQKQRERWEDYRQSFFAERLNKLEGMINQNTMIPFDQGDTLFQKIKGLVQKKGTFDVTKLEDDTPVKPTTADPEGDPEDQWTDFSIPSPSTIDFEIGELQKLVALEPEKYDFKIKMTFNNVSLMTDLEKATMVSGLVKSGIIDVDKAQELIELDDVVEQKKVETELDKAMIKLAKKFGATVPQQPNVMVDAATGAVINPETGMMQNRDGTDNSADISKKMQNSFNNGINSKTPTVNKKQTSTP